MESRISLVAVFLPSADTEKEGEKIEDKKGG